MAYKSPNGCPYFEARKKSCTHQQNSHWWLNKKTVCPYKDAINCEWFKEWTLKHIKAKITAINPPKKTIKELDRE